MRYLRLVAVCTVAVLAVTALVPGVAHAAGPDPASVYLVSISYGGTGCPQGSVGSSFSNDRTSATLIFDSFVASSGPGVPVTESRKNCQLNVNVHAPRSVIWGAGLSLAHRGYAQAPAGVSGNRSDTVYSEHIVLGHPHSNTFHGPVAEDYLALDGYTLSSLDNVLCKGEQVFPVNVNSQVRIVGPAAASAQITTDSIDIKVEPSLIVPCLI